MNKKGRARGGQGRGGVRGRGRTLAKEPSVGRGSVKRGRGARRVSTSVRGTRGRGVCQSTRPDKDSDTDARMEEVRGLIDQLGQQELQQILLEACLKLPNLVIKMKHVIDKQDVGEPDEPAPTPGANPDAPNWCRCTNCKDQHVRQDAKVCCGLTRAHCLSESETFRHLCLDEAVVSVASRAYRDMLALPIQNVNSVLRHAAYRQYIFWQYGILGEGNRRAIPSCCVWRIRQQWPDPNGIYVDFIPKRLGHFD